LSIDGAGAVRPAVLSSLLRQQIVEALLRADGWRRPRHKTVRVAINWRMFIAVFDVQRLVLFGDNNITSDATLNLTGDYTVILLMIRSQQELRRSQTLKPI
jgi:hypothetical protein